MRESGASFKAIADKIGEDTGKCCALVSGKNCRPYLARIYPNREVLEKPRNGWKWILERTPNPKALFAVSDTDAYWAVEPAMGGEQYIAPTLKFRLNNRSPEAQHSVQAMAVFRRKVVEALGQMGPHARSAVPVLDDLLKEEDATLRQAAAEALRKINPETDDHAGGS